MHWAELQLSQSGLRYNIIRPNCFMQNFNMNCLPAIRQTGDILLLVGYATGSFINVRDIA